MKNESQSLRIKVAVTLTLVATGFVFVLANYSPRFSPLRGDSNELRATENYIHRNAEFLFRILQDSGKFIYRMNMNPNVEVVPKYNWLRHAGTLFSMADYLKDFPNPKYQAKVIKSLLFMRDKAIRFVPREPQYLAVWSDPAFTNGRKFIQAKLGGTALAVVAYLTFEKIQKGIIPPEELRRLGDFLLRLQKEDGSYYSKWIPSKGGPDDSWTSLYYPGESALALALLYEWDGDEKWLKGAVNTIRYLYNVRSTGKQKVEPDHWALIATGKIFEVGREKLTADEEIDINAHTVLIVQRIMDDQLVKPLNPQFKGAFHFLGRTTPTATRLEGLLAAYPALPETEIVLRDKLKKVIAEGINFTLSAQVKSGPFRGAVPRSKLASVKDERSTEIRIDYNQHGLSAALEYRRQFLLQKQVMAKGEH